MRSRLRFTEGRLAAGLVPVCLGLLVLGCRPTVAVVAPVALRIDVPDADADADVYVDGHYVGQARALGQGSLGTMQLAPGAHRVEVRKDGRFPVQRTVTVDGDSPAELHVTAELLEDPQ